MPILAQLSPPATFTNFPTKHGSQTWLSTRMANPHDNSDRARALPVDPFHSGNLPTLIHCILRAVSLLLA